MQSRDTELIRTRTTLLHRLKDWQDQASWQDFFDTYWKLIYGVALKRGLTAVEAEDVVQETMISVAKHMPGFKYDRITGSFKSWLLNMARWRIADQYRKRALVSHLSASHDFATDKNIDDVASQTDTEFEILWNIEWQRHLFEAAIVRVKRSNPQQYQIFDLYVNKQLAAGQIAKNFGIEIGQVYLTKHRVTSAIKEQVAQLEKAMT